MTSRILSVALMVAGFLAACAPTQTMKPMTEAELKALRDSAQASYSIGQQYFSQGDYESALRNFIEATKIDSTFYEAYVAIGSTYRKLRDAVNAELYYQRAVALDPTKPKAYEGLGDLFLSLGETDRALATYLSGLAKDSSLVDLYNGAAEVYVRKGEMARADSLYQVAMRRFPDDQNVQRLWADFLFKQKRYQDAVNALLPLVARYPKVMSLRQRLVDCYIELKDYNAAVSHLDSVLTQDPNDSQTLLRKGAVLMMQNKAKAAGTIFETLTQRDSTRPEYWAYWGEALVQQGNPSAAEIRFRRALMLSPGMAQANVGLGDIRLKSADSKRGSNLTATSTANLRAARALYEEAKGFYVKAQTDPGYAEYARARIEYADRNIILLDKELFVRD